MTPKSHLSTELFAILDDLGVGLRAGTLVGFDLAAYEALRTRYQMFTRERDVALMSYLSRHETLFRTYLRSSRRTFTTAYQVLWYMDEIVVRDPLATFLTQDRDGVNALQAVAHNLELLFSWRPYIEAGYLLLAGTGVISPLQDDRVAAVKHLASQPAIQAALDSATRCGMVRRKSQSGLEWVLYDAMLDSEFRIGFSNPEIPAGQSESVGYTFGERLPQATVDEIAAATGQTSAELLDLCRSMFPREIASVLHSVGTAARLKSAVLCDRDADQIILQQALSPPADLGLQLATTGVLDLALPYLEGASAAQLLELRAELPQAFLEFRAGMHSIVSRAMAEDPLHAARLARVMADREVLPSLRALDADLAASARRNRLLGWGSTIVSVAGTLVGALTGNDAVSLSSLVAGLGGPLAAAAGFAGDQRAIVKSPFFFLWRAHR